MYSMMPVHDACFVMHHDVVNVKQDDQMTYHKALAMSSVSSLLPKVPDKHLSEFSMPSALYFSVFFLSLVVSQRILHIDRGHLSAQPQSQP